MRVSTQIILIFSVFILNLLSHHLFAQENWPDNQGINYIDSRFGEKVPDRQMLKVTDEMRELSSAYFDELFTSTDSEFETVSEISEKINKLKKKKSFNLSQISKFDLAKTLYLISFTNRGRRLISELMPLYIKGHFEITTDYSKNFAASGNLENTANYDLGKISLIPKNTSLGYMYNLVHEGTHAVDLAGTKEDVLIHAFLNFCKNYHRNINQILAGLDSNTANIDLIDETMELFYTNFPTLALDRDKEKKPIVKASKLIEDVSYLQQTVSMLIIEAEHRAYRAQEIFLKELSLFSDGTWETGMRVSTDSPEISIPIDKELFIKAMEDIYKIHPAYLERYFSIHEWEDFD